MIKPIRILEVAGFEIVCEFSNGEIKRINLEQALNSNSALIDKQKLSSPEFFASVKIGELGQLFWENTARMKDENGNYFPCEYDISPEYVYSNSIAIKPTLRT